MKIVGLTGGIAAGKSTVSALLHDRFGFPVIDADRLSRQAVEKGSAGLSAVEKLFGSEILLEDGSLNRSALGRKICEQPEAKENLDALLHPIITDLYQKEAACYRAAGENIVIYDCPLLIEAEQYQNVDTVLLVVTDERTRLHRIMERDQVDEDLARQKIAIQMSDEAKMQYADTVLYNNGTVADLYDALALWVEEIKK